MTTINNYNKLVDLVFYVIKNYPHKNELSKARLTKIIYLLDWKSSLDYWEQITDINWYFDSYWPYVTDIVKIAENEDLFKLEPYMTYYNNIWTNIYLNDLDYNPEISDNIKNVFAFIVKEIEKLNFNDFIDLVYSTYPIQVSERYSYLNLTSLANEYKNN